jgi:hypothetical protein
MFTLPSKTTRAIVAFVLALMVGGGIAGSLARAAHPGASGNVPSRVVLVPPAKHP